MALNNRNPTRHAARARIRRRQQALQTQTATQPDPATTQPDPTSPHNAPEPDTDTPVLHTQTSPAQPATEATTPHPDQTPYPTGWETETLNDEPHITFTTNDTKTLTLPIETFLQISEDIAALTSTPEETATHWAITRPETGDKNAPTYLNLMDGRTLLHQIPIDSSLATALHDPVLAKSKKNPQPKSLKDWTRKNPKRAWTLYIFGGLIMAILLYNALQTWITQLINTNG